MKNANRKNANKKYVETNLKRARKAARAKTKSGQCKPLKGKETVLERNLKTNQN